jgi:hypothetical protein
VDTILDRAWLKMAPFAPQEDLQEMAGLADGSGIPLRVIHRMHAIPDLCETRPDRKGRSNGLAACVP